MCQKEANAPYNKMWHGEPLRFTKCDTKSWGLLYKMWHMENGEIGGHVWWKIIWFSHVRVVSLYAICMRMPLINHNIRVIDQRRLNI